MPSVVTRVGVFAVSMACLFAQQPSAPEAPVILRATTRLVMVSVIARDSGGRPITDLKKEDFRIKVGGKVQEPTVFSMETTEPAVPGSSASAGTPGMMMPPGANVFSNRVPAQTGTPSSVNIILFDTRNTRVTDQIYAKAQIVRYLRTLQPGDHVGLYTFGGSLKVLHDYTSDSTTLLQQLKAAKDWTLPDTSNQDAQGALQSDGAVLDGFIRGAGGASPAERAFYTTDRILATMHTFEFIAQHLAQLPGRKNLIWVSGGFPLDIGFDSIADFKDPMVDQRMFGEEMDRTLRAMNEANISVYPVDARGLMTDPRFSAENRSAPMRPSMAPMIGVKEQQTMQEMASRTGGLAFYNTNDLAHAIHQAADDSRVTYTIGFYPQGDSFDGKFHKLDVEVVGRSGVKLRYRKGYFDVADRPGDEKTRLAELRDAVWSPIDASAMGITAMVRPVANNPASLDISMKIDHSTIGLQREQARWQGGLNILLVQRDDQGREFAGNDDKVDLNLTQDTYEKLMADNLAYHRVMPRAAGAKILRIVVRDASSGAIGSVTVPLAKVR